MPFDGTYFPATTPYDTGLFPLWSRQGYRLWYQTRLRGKKAAAPTMLRAPTPAERGLAVADLLRDAKDMVADPKDWTRRTYRSFGGQRCAVGALRAAAKRLERSDNCLVGACDADRRRPLARVYQCRDYERPLIACSGDGGVRPGDPHGRARRLFSLKPGGFRPRRPRGTIARAQPEAWSKPRHTRLLS